MPDELLFSVLARTALQNALSPPKHCMKVFFGDPNVIPSADLPVGLEIYRKRLGQFSPFGDYIDILNRCTLYPYFRPFLPAERHLRCMEIFRDGGGGGLKTLMGTVANGFGAGSALRFCSLCVQENFKNDGVIYWHRSHNLPAVKNCMIHAIGLSEHTAHLTSGSRQTLFLPPFPIEKNPSVTEVSKISALAHLSIELIEANLPPIDTKLRTVVYQQALLARELCTKKHAINFNALVNEMRMHYEDFNNFEHQSRLLSSPKEPLRWLRDILVRPDRAMHPICHLLLIGFLFGSIDRFIKALELTANNQKLLVEDVVNTKKNLCQSRCHQAIENVSKSCRQAALESGLSVTTVVELRRKFGIPVSERRKHIYRDVVDSIIVDLIAGKGINIIAEQRSISISSVYRILRSNPEINTERSLLRKQQSKTRKRLEWMTLIDTEGINGLNAVRACGADIFTWLYRHDHDWLKQANLRCGVVPRSGITRIDWSSRDLLLSKSVAVLVEEMRKDKTRGRVSKTLILRHLGCEALLRKFPHKLPQLRDAIVLYSETVLEYQKYRIERAIDELLTTEPFPVMWKIKRHATIRSWSEELLSHAVNYREQAIAARFTNSLN